MLSFSICFLSIRLEHVYSYFFSNSCTCYGTKVSSYMWMTNMSTGSSS